MLVKPEDFALFTQPDPNNSSPNPSRMPSISTQSRLLPGTLVSKEYATYCSTQSLVALAASCDLAKIGEKFGVLLPVQLSSTDNNTNHLPKEISLNIEVQLFKEDTGNIERQLSWITSFKRNQLPNMKHDMDRPHGGSNFSGGSLDPKKSGKGGYRDHSDSVNDNLDFDPAAPKLGKMKRRQAIKRPKQIEQKNHRFSLTFFRQPTYCGICNDFIWGVTQQQAYKCVDCVMACHEKCVERVLDECRLNTIPKDREAGTVDTAKTERFNINIPHAWSNHTFFKPTFCCHCGQMLYGLVRQGLKCKECSKVCHNKCRMKIPNNCGIDALKMVEALEQIEQAKIRASMTQKVQPDKFETENYGRLEQMSQSIYHSLAVTNMSTDLRKQVDKRLGETNNSEYASLSMIQESVKAVKLDGSKPYEYEFPDSTTSSMCDHYLTQKQHEIISKLPTTPGDQTTPVPPARTFSISQSKTHPGLQSPGKMMPPVPPKRPASRVKEPGIDDFQLLKVLGQGSFGKVFLAQFKSQKSKPRKVVAIKALRKDATIENNDVTATLIERNILRLGHTGKCPFLATLICSFQDDDRLYFVMEFLAGGDLMFHVQKHNRFRTHEARFYACEIACALEFLHNNKIVYRDLKLDNVLLDKDGHVSLADFGMCKEKVSENNKCVTFCGTPDYLAPEIVKGRLYTFSVDWWSFGVLLYEMILGQSPFYGRSEEELYNNILTKELQYHPRMLPQAKDCLRKLFQRDPTRRLGVVGRVLEHPFFTDELDVKAVCEKKVKPFFVPKIGADGADSTYFDQEFTTKRVELSRCDKRIAKNEQVFFTEFSHVDPDLFQFYKQ